MTYIDRNLVPNETILFRTKKTLVIFLVPFILTIFAIYASYYMQTNSILNRVDWVPALIVFIIWCQTGLDYWSSEYAVTNKRVMMREGFFVRHANEMRLNSISQVNVAQSLIGQLLNYGVVSINAFGAFDAYPMIDKPMLFQKYVNEELYKVQGSPQQKA